MAPDGATENCLAHNQPQVNVSRGPGNGMAVVKRDRSRLRRVHFFGYEENSLLYELVPEMMRRYEWM